MSAQKFGCDWTDEVEFVQDELPMPIGRLYVANDHFLPVRLIRIWRVWETLSDRDGKLETLASRDLRRHSQYRRGVASSGKAHEARSAFEERDHRVPECLDRIEPGIDIRKRRPVRIVSQDQPTGELELGQLLAVRA
jgi:hypothetical protein